MASDFVFRDFKLVTFTMVWLIGLFHMYLQRSSVTAGQSNVRENYKSINMKNGTFRSWEEDIRICTNFYET